MPSVALTGSDTLTINSRPITDFADGNIAELDYPNDIASVKTGKDGNSIYGKNESGKQSDLKLRIIRGSADDKFLNNLLSQQDANFAGFTLMTCNFIKKIGDGQSNIGSDTLLSSGGVFTKKPPAKSNVEGDSEQSVAIYTLKFSNTVRVIR